MAEPTMAIIWKPRWRPHEAGPKLACHREYHWFYWVFL